MATVGHVYILNNASMPGKLKIGKTSKSPEQRAAELSAPTAVPCPFEVAFDILVADIDEADRRVHSILAKYRVNRDREFFQAPLKIAIKVLEEVQREISAEHLHRSKEIGVSGTGSGSAKNPSRATEELACPASTSHTKSQEVPSDTQKQSYRDLSAEELALILGKKFLVRDEEAKNWLVQNRTVEDLIFAKRVEPVQPIKRQSQDPLGGLAQIRAASDVKDVMPLGTSELPRTSIETKRGDDSEKVTLNEQLLVSHHLADARRQWLLQAAKDGRADVCAELGRLWPETGSGFLQRLSLFWIAASSGDASALQEFSKYWPILPADSLQQMREFARELNPKFECKDLPGWRAARREALKQNPKTVS